MKRSRIAMCGIAMTITVTLFGYVAPTVQADEPAPAARFADADDEVNRILAGRVTAAGDVDSQPVTQQATSIDTAAGRITNPKCPAGAKVCVKLERVTDEVGAEASGWPAVCSANQYDTTPKWLAVSRKAGCHHEKLALVAIDVETKKVVGTATFHLGLTATAVAGGAGWNTTAYLAMWKYTGKGRPQFVFSRLSPIPTGATGGVTEWNSKSTNDVWKGKGWMAAPTLKAKAVKKGVGAAWTLTFSSSEWANRPVYTSDAFKSRCDRYYSTPGCVFNTMPGVATFSKATAPQYAKHVSGAMKSGLPGKFGGSTHLTRITNKTQVSKNRSRACPASLVRQKGYSCDEYPFASTKQGAYTSKATKARSQPWCQMPDPERKGSKGWSRCFINATQNSIGGGYLSGFYRAERMLAGDKFQVGFIA